jgi:hypothetical protein
MNQTWQHTLDEEQEPGRCRRGEPVEIKVATEAFPDNISTIKSERELNAFWWVQVTGIPDVVTLQDYQEWLMPQHEAVSKGKMEYRFLNAAPGLTEFVTGDTSGVTGQITAVEDSFTDAVQYTGTPDDFERGEWIWQDDNNAIRARIKGRDTEPDGSEWFTLDQLEGTFEPGKTFTGQTSGGQATVVKSEVSHAGRLKVESVTGTGASEPETVTLSPSGTTGWLMRSEFTQVARKKRLLPFSGTNTPQQVRDDFQSKFWTQVTHDQMKQMTKRQPDDQVPPNNADAMDAQTLDDDYTGAATSN